MHGAVKRRFLGRRAARRIADLSLPYSSSEMPASRILQRCCDIGLWVAQNARCAVCRGTMWMEVRIAGTLSTARSFSMRLKESPSKYLTRASSESGPVGWAL